jgi:hypothetical protein
MWCEICHKFNHITCDCFKNPANFQQDELAPANYPGDIVNYEEGKVGEESIS